MLFLNSENKKACHLTNKFLILWQTSFKETKVSKIYSYSKSNIAFWDSFMILSHDLFRKWAPPVDQGEKVNISFIIL